MKRLFTLCAIVVAVVVSSCQYDDTDIWKRINDHESRIAALEELCKQMNTNITALQTIVEALEKNDYITNVSPVRKDGEVVGYNISFAKSDSITIYHGENGRDGTDGKDGYTPQIGVMKDTDGIYYWTLDGEWLLDGNGDKIKAVGDDGMDGTTPRLKIENDCWYVSYDEGATWIELGKSVSDNCLNKDNLFISITQDDEYVYFNLADGNVIVLPKNMYNSDYIVFEDPIVKAICCAHWDIDGDGELSKEEAGLVTDIEHVFNGIYHKDDALITIGNHSIIKFNELRYFKNVKTIPRTAFSFNLNMTEVTLPCSVEYIYGSQSFTYEISNKLSGASIIKSVTLYPFANTLISKIILPESLLVIDGAPFTDANHLKEIYCKGVNPPVLYGRLGNNNCRIFVPMEAVDTYKSSYGWENHSSQIIGYDFEE